MKKFLSGIVIGLLLGVGVANAIPKDAPRVCVPYEITKCPPDFTPQQCAWWDNYQREQQRRWDEIIRQMNKGFSYTFESIRSLADSVGNIP